MVLHPFAFCGNFFVALFLTFLVSRVLGGSAFAFAAQASERGFQFVSGSKLRPLFQVLFDLVLGFWMALEVVLLVWRHLF